jgi:uncharacterized membrane protein
VAKKQTKKAQPFNWHKFIAWLMFVCGLIGTIAAASLTIEYIEHLKNPHFVPVCNLNPIFSCSSVMESKQAHAFGIPNEVIGLAGYGGVTAIGLALLAGGQFKRWFWKLVNVGLLVAVAFLTWLQFQTLYRIGALCLFCMLLWAVTIPLFWYTSVYNLRTGNLVAPVRLRRVTDFIVRHHFDVLLLWLLIIVALILKRFWYYFGNL